jgi:deoxyribodipyrimidine photolyase
MDHQDDPREAVYSWERLCRGQTGDALWDAAQKSLLVHGELHNNVRMTWGKAFLSWARHPQDALDLMIDLNHRFALDGNDPNSYGGLLWCLGLLDHGHKVQVFEKTSRPGGRIATHTDLCDAFDTGAQYFTTHDDRLQRYV